MAKLNQTHGNAPKISSGIFRKWTLFSAKILLFSLITCLQQSIFAQCNVQPGSIDGYVLVDQNFNGKKDATDVGMFNVTVVAYNNVGTAVAQTFTDAAGFYRISGLQDGSTYRIVVKKPFGYEYAMSDFDYMGDQAFVTAPMCNLHFGLSLPAEFNNVADPQLAVTCFVYGDPNEKANLETVVRTNYFFKGNSAINKIATKQQTGAVWGLAWKRSTQELFSAAFVKSGAALGSEGLGGIYVSNMNTNTTAPFVNLSTLGINVGNVGNISAKDCNYSDYVGKAGLGDMDITDDNRYLIATNLFNKSIVLVPTQSPSAQNIIEIKVPDPGCNLGDYAVGAIKYYRGKVYIGVTCTAENSKKSSDFAFHVYEMDLITKVFNIILSTTFGREYWDIHPASNLYLTSQWLTDIDFTDEGNMILAIADRKGHTYCDPGYYLTNQNGDILAAWKNNGKWTLENNGYLGSLTGSGVGRNEGPGGGEFFGDDYWVVGPGLHPETSMGSLAVMPGSHQVASTVFDPLFESIAGGIHRYSTTNGKISAAIQLYNQASSAFGKASGLGDLEIMAAPAPIEIGNYLWYDKNENGLQEAGEQGLAGITVCLYNANCEKIGQSITNATGQYLFSSANVTPGALNALSNYYIVIVDPNYNTQLHYLLYGKDTLKMTITKVGANFIADAIDSDGEIMNVPPCGAIADLPVVSLTTGGPGQNRYDIDFGFIKRSPTDVAPPPDGPLYDLALVKKLSSMDPVQINKPVTYDILVLNQGSLNVDYFEVVDYLPIGLSFSAAANPDWTISGNKAVYRSKTNIASGELVTIPITLTILASADPNGYINTAEIKLMKNAKGELLKDEDSTPDDIDNNDAGGIPNSITDNVFDGNGTDDEDDHDRESLSVYDLALIKTTTNTTGVKANDVVTFDIKVKNQGNNAIASYTIVDYIPQGLSFEQALNPNWVLINGIAKLTINGGIAGNVSQTQQIKLRVKPNTTADQLVNIAEISNMKDFGGNSIDDSDSSPDENPNNDLGGGIGTITDDQMDAPQNVDEDDQDAAIVPVFDLALIKVAKINTPVKAGDAVPFDITVYNQGNSSVFAIDIVDYLPTGYTFDGTKNIGWLAISNQLKLTSGLELKAGASRIFKLTLDAKTNDAALLINHAEISGIRNALGQNLIDWDSTPDSNPANDKGGLVNSLSDNQLNGNGSDDEDDEDPAAISLFDLALILKNDGSQFAKIGQDIIQIVQICNQGNLAAQDISVIDYLPGGLSLSPLDNNGWFLSGGKLINNYSKTLEPGNCAEIKIVLRVNENADINSLLNRAEIFAAKNVLAQEVAQFDVDSKADQTKGNDVGGVYNSATDNLLTGNGINDEDDEDPENVPVYDLALDKKLVLNPFLKYNGEANFDISIYNQGNLPVQSIKLVDYIPFGFAMATSSVNAGWYAENNQFVYLINKPLNPGEQTTVRVTLKGTSLVTLDNLVNRAEIVSFRDITNLDRSNKDFDSTPDALSSNDNGGVLNSNSDNLITDHGKVDEDDADPATIEIFDLALLKKLKQPELVVHSGDNVTFTMDIWNQGNIVAKEIEIVDYLDVNFTFDPAINPGWTINGNKIYYTIKQNLIPGTKLSADITLKVKPNSNGLQLPNFAEIKRVVDEFNRNPVDYDSTPDDISNNDLSTNPAVLDNDEINDHGIIDEDDHDGAITNPLNFDLALMKDVAFRTVQPNQDLPWTITVINEGTVTAHEIELVDYVPDYLQITDVNWVIKNANPTKYYIVLNEKNGRLPQGGLKPGGVVKITIATRVKANALPGAIVNRAEIYSAKNDFNVKDDDSTPDDIINNDKGGEVFEGTDISGSAPGDPEALKQDEDDADPAGVIVLRLDHAECQCLNNASAPGNGQFITDFTLESRNNEVWFIKSVNGLYQNSSPAPPAAPTPFTTGPGGNTLSVITTNGPITVYGISGLHIDNVPYNITVENQFGDKVNLGNTFCRYDYPELLEAPNAVCSNASVKYKAKSIAGRSYLWTLYSGGNIIGSSTNATVEIKWNAAIGTSHILRLEETDNNGACLSPVDIQVKVVTPAAEQMNCIGNTQVSLNSNCQATVTPQMLLTGGPYDYTAYAVMLFNKDNTIIPNATVNYSHINQKLIAKVTNACTGNSCWTTVSVEDKIKPTIECVNDTIECTRMRSYLGPLVSDNCDPNPQKILLDEVIETPDCDPLFGKIVTRKYQAKDQSGNLSNICTMKVFLKHLDLDSIVFPDSFTIGNLNPLLCNGFPLDSLGHPEYWFTGVPTYKGTALYPIQDPNYCKYGIQYTDTEIPTGKSCVRKIMRRWWVFNWYCNTRDERVYYQLFEIIDNKPPTIICPYNINTTTSGGYKCEANVWIPRPITFDSCVNDVRVDLVYPGGFISNFNGQYIVLPAGLNELKFRAYDRCLNVDSCTFTVYVKDQAAPVAICDRETTVSLDRFGQAWVPAYGFDDGSYDDCHIKSMQVRRMDDGVPCGYNPDILGDSVGFCCVDVGKVVQVLFVVTDFEGNSNTCMVNVEVQDKIAPRVTAPHDITLSCKEIITKDSLYKYGSASVSDNCKATLTEVDSFYINQCREGYIDRIFIAGNAFGQDVDVQRITIINEDPFDPNDIIWPYDYETSTCDVGVLQPENLPFGYDKPRFIEDECDLVGVTHEDHVFRIVSGTEACYKVLRKWKIINWCRLYDQANNLLSYEHTQVIKVKNTVAPEFLTGCEDKTFYSTDSLCLGADVVLKATGEDDCTPAEQLVWQYFIDLNSDGSFDYSNFGIGSEIDASGFYALGKHRIKYVFEDLCGNKKVCDRQFEIINNKKPSAYCKFGLAANLVAMDNNGDGKIDGEMVCVWARDFDNGSSHPCGYPLTYSIGKDTSIHSICYNCDSIGRREVLLCVTATNGEQDCCYTFIDIQDNNDVDFCNCVKFPPNLTVNTCNPATDPTSLNSFPNLGNCKCAPTNVTHEDSIGNVITNGCYKIFRTWTIVFNCPGLPNSEFAGTQEILVTTNLKLSDITWPADTLIIDNCTGKLDTIDKPKVTCEYNGSIMIMNVDVELFRNNDEVVYRRTWTVFSKCVAGQTFSRSQILRVKNPNGIRYMVPADITVTDCKKPLLPDSLNGFPKTNCPCNFATHTFKDSTVNTQPNSCLTIYRKWTSTFNCPPDVQGTFMGTQKITIKVDLQLKDIMWPVDSLVVDNCGGKIDTGTIKNVPKLLKDFCGFVSITFKDSITSNNDTCKLITRKWIVTNECTTGAGKQQYTFNQKLKVRFPNGPRFTWPADITVTDCKKPLLPDSLNGFPKILCSCDSVTYTFKDDTVFTNKEICYLVNRDWSAKVRCRPIVDTTIHFVQKITRDVNLNPADIMWPTDTFTSLTCVPTLDPKFTGMPTLKKDYCGLITFTFKDTLNPGPCITYKRVWTAKNACSATQSATFNQFIVVKNQTPPSITCAPDVTVNSDPNACGATVIVPNPTVNGSCNTQVTFTKSPAGNLYPVGKTNVIFTAKDSCNHTSVCTTMVTVLENTPPVITCPKDTTVPCSVNTDDLTKFGFATATDNCQPPAPTITDTVKRNQNVCGIGTIMRTFTATDASGNKATCTQTIIVNNPDPIDSIDVNWPPTVHITECAGASPDSTGKPTVKANVSCYKIKTTFADTSKCNSGGGCVIERKWTVFDSCSGKTLMYTQSILRDDQNAPIITGVKDTTLYASDTACNNFVTLIAGTSSCDSNLVVITNDSPFGKNKGKDASGFYPVGMTMVTFTAMDACCNISTKKVTITILDTVKPEFVCKKAVKDVTDTGCAVFHARDFVFKMSDNCTDSSMLMVSFSKTNFMDTTLLICCNLIKNHDYTGPATIWFKDAAGNIDSCNTLLQATDSKKICPDSLINKTGDVKGLVKSRKDFPMGGIEVQLQSKGVVSENTNNTGFYQFIDMPFGGTYDVVPTHDVDPVNGVTTYDIVQIQKHILGTQVFTDPLKFIAADVNKSKSVTSADISEIRKLILGKIPTFTKNASWRFIDTKYQFKDKEDPLHEDFTEVGAIPKLDKNFWFEFTGIKVGDVDDSNKGFTGGTAQIRTSNTFTIYQKDQQFEKGNVYQLEVEIPDWTSLEGLQTALYIDPTQALIQSVEFVNGSVVGEEHIGINDLDKGIVKLAWDNIKTKGEWKLKLNVKALTKCYLSQIMSLNQAFMTTEAYSKQNELMNLSLEFKDLLISHATIKLYQNIPNPFRQSTIIPFELIEDMKVTIVLTDINGRLIYSTSGNFKKGYNEVEILKKYLNKAGVYYYQLQTARDNEYRRMLMLD